MSKIEKFGLVTSIIGLTADILTLLGFALGMVEISPSLGNLRNPFVVATVTMTFLLFCIWLLLIFITQYAKNKWRQTGVMPQRFRDGLHPGLRTIATLLWAPTSILWGISTIQYFWSYYLGDISFTDIPEGEMSGFAAISLLVFFYFATIPWIGGEMISRFAVDTSEFFDPSHYFI